MQKAVTVTRLLGPSEGSRLVYAIGTGDALQGLPFTAVTFYADDAGADLADILTAAGSSVSGSVLTTDANSLLPDFQFPDGVDTLYAQIGDGPLSPVYAREDARIDAVATLAYRGNPPHAPAAMVRRLETGYWPCSLLLLGDSTGNSTGEWFSDLAIWLAAEHPRYRSRYQLWSDAAQAYAAPSWLSTGTGTRRTITVPASSGINLTTPNSVALTITGDLDVRATVTIDTMPPGQNVDVCGKTAAAPNRSWWLSITSTGFLQLSWTVDGTTTLSQTSSLAIPAGAKTLRAVLDVDNGATQHTVIFYTSTDWDGATGTWTQLGTTRTTAGVTSIFAGTSSTQLVSRSAGTWPVAGSVTGMQVYSGSACVIDVDMGTLADAATTLTDYTGNVWTLIGAPARAGDLTLSFYNGSVAGENVAYANDATRFPKLTPFPADVAMISYGHNESGITYTGYATLTAALIAKWSTVGIVPVLQNPQSTAGRTAAQISAHAMRLDLVATTAALSRWPVIDAYRAFIDSGGDLTVLIPDGLHPTAAGQALWLAEAKKLFAREV